jgi:hypothetical protein
MDRQPIACQSRKLVAHHARLPVVAIGVACYLQVKLFVARAEWAGFIKFGAISGEETIAWLNIMTGALGSFSRDNDPVFGCKILAQLRHIYLLRRVTLRKFLRGARLRSTVLAIILLCFGSLAFVSL